MNVLTTLIKEQRIAYIFTRLFDYSDKIKAEHLEQVVIKAIERAHLQANLTYDPPSPYTFVPFRDTEQDMIDSPDQIRIIYDADIERLKRAFLLVGFLDGLSKDEGICMEIGYAFGLGTPVLLISTDFIWRAIKNCENTTHVIDPVIDLMVTRLIRKYDIPPQDAPFLDRLLAAQNVVYAQVEEAVYQLLLSDPTQPKWTTDSAAHFDVYLEFGGGLFEWERRLMSQLSDELTCEGFRVAQSARYLPDAALRSAVERGQADLHHALHASVIVVCSDSMEMNPGSAAIQGLARSQDKQIVLYDSKTTQIVGANQYRSSRNLMIECSANIRVSHADHLVSAVKTLLQGERSQR